MFYIVTTNVIPWKVPTIVERLSKNKNGEVKVQPILIHRRTEANQLNQIWWLYGPYPGRDYVEAVPITKLSQILNVAPFFGIKEESLIPFKNLLRKLSRNRHT